MCQFFAVIRITSQIIRIKSNYIQFCIQKRHTKSINLYDDCHSSRFNVHCFTCDDKCHIKKAGHPMLLAVISNRLNVSSTYVLFSLSVFLQTTGFFLQTLVYALHTLHSFSEFYLFPFFHIIRNIFKHKQQFTSQTSH